MNLTPTFNGPGQVVAIDGLRKLYIKPVNYLDVAYPIYDSGGSVVKSSLVIEILELRPTSPQYEYVNLNSEYRDAGVVAFARVNGEVHEVSDYVTHSTNLTTDKCGVYDITYTLDLFGTKSSISRQVEVVEVNYINEWTPEVVLETSALHRQINEKLNDLMYDFNYEIDQSVSLNDIRKLATEWRPGLPLTTDYISYHGHIWSNSAVPSTRPPRWKGSWNRLKYYVTNDQVVVNGIQYNAISKSNGVNPTLDNGSHWVQATATNGRYYHVGNGRDWATDDRRSMDLATELGIPRTMATHLLNSSASRDRLFKLWKAFMISRGTRRGLSSILRYLQEVTQSQLTQSQYPTWNSTTQYFVGDRVKYLIGQTYSSYEAIRPSLNSIPSLNPTIWASTGEEDVRVAQVNPEYSEVFNKSYFYSYGNAVDGLVCDQNAQAWSSTTTYRPGLSAIYNDSLYVATSDVTGVLPTDETRWKLVYSYNRLASGNNSEYLISVGSLGLSSTATDYDQSVAIKSYQDTLKFFTPDWVDYVSEMTIPTTASHSIGLGSIIEIETASESSFGIVATKSGSHMTFEVDGNYSNLLNYTIAMVTDTQFNKVADDQVVTIQKVLGNFIVQFSTNIDTMSPITSGKKYYINFH